MALDALGSGLAWALTLVHFGLWGVLAGNLWYLRRRRTRARLDVYPALSVLIPARNEARNLKRLLPSLLTQAHPAFEVIVYDDGSDDATWEVLQSIDDARLTALQGSGPPPGWVGKVHALYQATRHASGAQYVFLDADARLEDAGALQRLAERFASLPSGSVLTGLTRLRGPAALLVSLVPNAILIGLPWPLVRRLQSSTSLSALNGQCWMIDADAYHQHEPHASLPNEVLEDVMIGRYLKRKGLLPELVNVQQEVSIYMYESLAAAWRGFRKNAYLILGGAPLPFMALFVYFMLVFVLAPLATPWLLLSIYGLKATTDRVAGFPWWVSTLAPLSYMLGNVLQLDSALSHWRGRVDWKGRRVGA
jgi:glycosyltransferase involved in cell wall biosynthesis